MKKIKAIVAGTALVAAAAGISSPVAAGDANGNIEIKVLGTYVTPQEKVKSWGSSNPAVANLLNGNGAFERQGASVSDALIPSLSISYFLTQNIAIETICCFTKHQVNAKNNGVLGQTGISQWGNNAEAWIFPPTMMLQYHFTGLGAVRPYIGVGASWFHFFGEKKGNNNLKADSVDLKDDVGLVVGGGLDISLGQGWFLSADVKKYFMDTDVRWSNARLRTVGVVESVNAKAELDPWLISAGIGYRFNWGDLFGGHRESLK